LFDEVNKQRSFEDQALYIKNVLVLPQRSAHCRDRSLIVKSEVVRLPPYEIKSCAMRKSASKA
jgi:hypothetical protein